MVFGNKTGRQQLWELKVEQSEVMILSGLSHVQTSEESYKSGLQSSSYY